MCHGEITDPFDHLPLQTSAQFLTFEPETQRTSGEQPASRQSWPEHLGSFCDNIVA